MENVLETVLVRFTNAQNEACSANTRAFYKLDGSIEVSKDLYVTKDSYQKYLHAKLRERTPYEKDKKFSEFGYDTQNYPFDVSYTKVSYKFPSGRILTLTEILTEPNGLTKLVELTDSDGESSNFKTFMEAEVEVIDRFLSEEKLKKDI